MPQPFTKLTVQLDTDTNAERAEWFAIFQFFGNIWSVNQNQTKKTLILSRGGVDV